jgi:hypothetical protein
MLSEQEAFDAKLESLLSEHLGQVVIFKDRQPIGFYESFKSAFDEALKLYGLEDVFLIAEIQEKKPTCASVSWMTGVMYTS